jgi:HSP20 family molecular chaperone IbpA
MTYNNSNSFENTLDILFKNFFDSTFDTITSVKIPHPVNCFETESELIFEIACTGVAKSDIEVETENNSLRIKYKKNLKETMNETAPQKVFFNSLSQKSFDLGWYIPDKFNVSKLTAKQFEGMLTKAIPKKQKSEVRKIEIQ